MYTVEIITIGNEVIIGRTIDTNASFLGQELTKKGFYVARKTTVRDIEKDILQALNRALDEHTIVLITGGLGPTKDDITKKLLTTYFGGELVFHESTFKHIEALFAQRGRTLTELNRNQAMLPSNAEAVFNAVGTAPGMRFKTANNKTVISMPGVPHEMKQMFTDYVLPDLLARYQTQYIRQHTYRTIGCPESKLAEMLVPVENQLPNNIELAYNPALNSVDLRLTLNCTIAESTAKLPVYNQLLDQIRQIIAPYHYADNEETLEEVVARLLTAANKKLAVAETHTGGALAARLYALPGASKFLPGILIPYDNKLKINLLNIDSAILDQHGAVSEAAAVAMAQAVRRYMHTDIGISLTGIAGPDGATETKPVGTTWIGYADTNTAFAKHFVFEKDRRRNIERSVLYALNLLRMELIK
jgi:nicotinamide-nucleotide amidase